MKKILLSIFMMVIGYHLNAQATVSLPTFNSSIVTMKVFTCAAVYDSYVAVSDGTQTYVVSMDRQAVNAEKEKTNNNLTTITLTLNKLKEQKYEVLTASAGPINDVLVTTYVLQKKE